MATGYDAPRIQPGAERANESLEALRTRTSVTTQAPGIDLEDTGTAEEGVVGSQTLDSYARGAPISS